MVVHRDAGMHVGMGAIALCVAVNDALAQLVHVGRYLDPVAAGLEGLEGIEERVEDREIGSGAGVAGVGREVKQHDGDLAVPARGVAQGDQLLYPSRQGLGALAVGLHVALLAVRGDRRASAIDHGSGAAVQLWDGHHHGGLDRQQALVRAFPLLDGLELDRKRGEVRDVESGQQLLGRLGVVIGRTAHQGEAGQGHDGVYRRLAVVHEEALDRGAGVESAGEGRDYPQAARLQGRDDAVVMGGVPRQDIGAHQEQAHRALGALGAGGNPSHVVGDTVGHTRVVNPDVGVLHRCGHLEGAAQCPARSVGIAVHQEADHIGDVLLGPREPVLQGEEIGAHVLGGARDEAQELGDAPQHRHLLGASAAFLLFFVAAQTLKQRHGSAFGAVHGEAAHACQAHHLARRHAANHGVALVPALLERGQDRLDMLLHHQHGDDDDVALGNVGAAAIDRAGVVRPLGGGVQLQRQARQVSMETRLCPIEGAGQVSVKGHQHHLHRGSLCWTRPVSVRSALSHRRASPQ